MTAWRESQSGDSVYYKTRTGFVLIVFWPRCWYHRLLDAVLFHHPPKLMRAHARERLLAIVDNVLGEIEAECEDDYPRGQCGTTQEEEGNGGGNDGRH